MEVAEHKGDMATANEAALWLERLDGDSLATSSLLARYYQRLNDEKQLTFWHRVGGDEGVEALVQWHLEREQPADAKAAITKFHATQITNTLFQIHTGQSVDCDALTLEEPTAHLPLLHGAGCYELGLTAAISRSKAGYSDAGDWILKNVEQTCDYATVYNVIKAEGWQHYESFEPLTSAVFSKVGDENQHTAPSNNERVLNAMKAKQPVPKSIVPPELTLAVLVYEKQPLNFDDYLLVEQRIAVEVALNTEQFDKVLKWTAKTQDPVLSWARAGALFAKHGIEASLLEVRRLNTHDTPYKVATIYGRSGNMQAARIALAEASPEVSFAWRAKWEPQNLDPSTISLDTLDQATESLANQGTMTESWAQIVAKRSPCNGHAWEVLYNSDSSCYNLSKLQMLKPLKYGEAACSSSQ